MVKTVKSSDSLSTSAKKVTVEQAEFTSREKRPVRHMFDFCLCYPDPSDCTTCSSATTSISISCNLSKEETNEDGTKLNSSYSEWFRLSAGSSSSSRPDLLTSNSTSSSDGSSFHENCEMIPFNKVGDNRSETMESKVEEPSIHSNFEISLNLEEKYNEIHELVRSSTQTFRQLKSWYEFAYGELDSIFESIKERIDCERRLIKKRDLELSKVCAEIDEHEENLNRILLLYQKMRAEYLRRLMDEDLMRMNRIKAEEIRTKIPNDLCSKVSKDEISALACFEKQISKAVHRFQKKDIPTSESELISPSEIEKLLTCRSFHEPDIPTCDSCSVPTVE